MNSTRPLDARSLELPLELLASRGGEALASSSSWCYPKTRIGLFGYSGATRTEPLVSVSHRSHRACGDVGLELAKGLRDPGIDEPLAFEKNGTVGYIDVDGLGSVVATNDASGAVTHSTAFDAWGVTRLETGVRNQSFTFTGREVGEAGLLFYRAREYHPLTGRFQTEDPLRVAGVGTLYRYVYNQPQELFDPHGLNPANSEYCRRLLEKIQNVQDRIKKRQSEYREDPLDLPERAPGDKERPSKSRWGHRRLMNEDKALLAALEAEYLAKCSCGSPSGPPIFFPDGRPANSFGPKQFQAPAPPKEAPGVIATWGAALLMMLALLSGAGAMN